MQGPNDWKCEVQGCKGKNAIYERNNMMMCEKCMREYDRRVHGREVTKAVDELEEE